MIRQNMRVAARQVRRRKGYAFITVSGLALSVAACLLILHFVQDEWAFDRFHERGDRIYRLVSEDGFPAVGWPYARILEEDFPEVEAVVTMRGWPSPTIHHEGRRYYEQVRYADSRFFEVFDFPLIEGAAGTALSDPYTIVLSERLADRLYGSSDAIGKVLNIGNDLDVVVTGVAKVPRQSHIQFDAMLSMATLRELMGPSNFDQQVESGWFNVNLITYVLVQPGTNGEALAAKVRNLPSERVGDQLSSMGLSLELGLEPLHSVYLRSPLGSAIGPSGDVSRVYLLSIVGAFILLLAGVNFVNLTTARSLERAREVGVRRAVGSSRAALVVQFLTESSVIGLAAVVLGVSIACVALPFFGELADRTYALSDLASPRMAGALLGLVFLIGIVGGLYPALALSGFRPADVLRGTLSTGPHAEYLRRGLVVVQFGISCVLLIGTLVVLAQLRYMQSQHPGFDSEQILIVDVQRTSERQRAVLKEILAAHSAVRNVAAAYAVPGQAGWRGQHAYPESLPDGQNIALEYMPVDHDYVATLGLEIVAGRDFDPDIAADAQQGVLINETAARAAGWTSPADAVGKRFTSGGSGKPEGTVIGVVRDHHHHGLQERIQPIMYGINPGNLGLLAIRVDTDQARSLIAYIERHWQEALAEHPLEYVFLNEAFARQYGEERRLGSVFGTFAFLAVVIGCLGLFGLAASSARRRRRELGIRKVLGASVARLVSLLSADYLILVIAAFVLSAPVGYWLATRWLEGFAYRISLNPGLFLAAGLIAFLVACATVAGQAWRAATADPVQAIAAD
jgi:putative ABC transport system permease protein